MQQRVQAIRSEVIANFTVLGTTKRLPVYPSVSNYGEDDKERHRFFHAPALLPKVDSAGKLILSALPGDKAAELLLVLSSPEIRAAALQQVRAIKGYATLPAYAMNATPFSRITAISFDKLPYDIHVVHADLHGTVGESDEMPIRFEAPSTERLRQFVETELPLVIIHLEIELESSTSRRANVRVTGRSVRQALTRVLLDGTGGQVAYVHRDDFRNMALNISRSLSVRGVVDDGVDLDRQIAREAVARFFQPNDPSLVSWADHIRAQTFNAADLQPSVVTEKLNKLFTWDQGKQRFFVNKDEYRRLQQSNQSSSHHSAQGGGSASFSFAGFGVGLGGSGGSSSGSSTTSLRDLTEESSFTQDQMVSMLNQHDCTAEVKGHLIEVKDVKVRQFNATTLSDDFEVCHVDVTVKDFQQKLKETVLLNRNGIVTDGLQHAIIERPTIETLSVGISELQKRLSEAEAATKQLQQQAAELSKQTLPIGSVAAFSGENLDALEPYWLLCDGRQLSKTKYGELYEKIGTVHGNKSGKADEFNLPDYRGLFLRGNDRGREIDPDRDTRTAAEAGANKGAKVGSFQGHAFHQHQHTATDSGHTHTARDTGHTHSFFTATSGLGVNGGRIAGAISSGLSQDFPGQNALHVAHAAIQVDSSKASITVEASGGKETRPVNSSVEWLIRAK